MLIIMLELMSGDPFPSPRRCGNQGISMIWHSADDGHLLWAYHAFSQLLVTGWGTFRAKFPGR